MKYASAFVCLAILFVLFGCTNDISKGFGSFNSFFSLSDIAYMSVEALNDEVTDFEGYVIMYAAFYDSQGRLIEAKNVNLPVEVSIFTSKYANDNKTRIPDRLLYNGNYTLTNLQASNNLIANQHSILIPRSSLGPIYDSDYWYGIASVTVYLSNNKTIQDNAYLVKLKKKP